MSELADETSRTRFGPRPVSDDHKAPPPDLGVRRILPHGDVSRDGLSRAPSPSLTAKILTYGGAGIVAAAATAGVVLAGRKLIDAITEDEPDFGTPRPRRSAPRHAAMAEDGYDLPRHQREDRERIAAIRARAESNRKRRHRNDGPGLARSILAVVGALPAVIEGFRAVAGQADTIMREFSDTANSLRNVADRAKPETQPEDDKRTHRL